MQKLNIDYTEDENKFIEYKIPEFVFQVLLLGDAEFTKHQFLNGFAQQDQTAVCSINHGLEKQKKKKKKKENEKQ